MKFGIILGLALACVSATPAWAAQRVTAAIMFSGGDDTSVGATENYAAIVEVSTKNVRRFVTQDQFSGGCVVLPLTFPVGTTVEITGAFQGAASVPGSVLPFAATETRAPNAATAITVIDGFDVEGYSTGLGPLRSEFDPTAAANMIATGAGYGFAWYDSFGNLKPGPYSYKVTGCGRKSCSTKVGYFNQINTHETPPFCTVLMPMSPQ
jgi:hypothetical protein